MTRPNVDTLRNSGEYQLVESFAIDEMTQFLAREAGLQADNSGKLAKNKAGFWFLMLGMGLFGGAIGWLIGAAFKDSVDQQWLGAGWQLGLGVLAFFVIVLPLHEMIHAIFFKFLGAPKVGFGYSAKGLMVYAYSQKFVMQLRENALVAAMPFLLITSLLVALLVFVPQLQFVWLIILIFHTLGCMGDFILIKHAWTNRRKNMLTYDDLEEKRTYFFVKS
ncbi:DUF3267 domain-containing protein [Persicitalea sp.]|uniref:DUF3267 domain-containing protein n=1 Tax=Persicitalea sp. TaxID=3100273 RepID=UPI0035948594